MSGEEDNNVIESRENLQTNKRKINNNNLENNNNKKSKITLFTKTDFIKECVLRGDKSAY